MSGPRLAAVALVVMLVGCFTGESTLGSVCREDADCGAEQRCTNEICGACGDGIPQRGELCLVSAVEFSSAPSMSGELQAGDLDGDRIPELLVRGADGGPQLWGRSADGWTILRSPAVGGARGALRLANLDDDEALDVVVVDEDEPALYLGFGAGDQWEFAAPLGRSTPPLDLAVADATWAGPAWVAWVDAEGLWQATVDAEARTLAEPVQRGPSRAQWLSDAVPIDGDDALDLVVADADGMTIEPWLGDGRGGLTPGEPLALEHRPLEVVAIDLDVDGDSDLLVPDEDGGVIVIDGDGEGGLVIIERMEVPAAAATGAVRALAVADLDRSTDNDVVVLGDAESGLSVFLARADRHPDGVALPVTAAVGSVVAVDFDRDGLTELLLGPAEGTGPLRVMEVEP